jgi:hypothetical protein
VVDLYGARHLDNRLVEEPVNVRVLASEAAKVDEDTNVSA